MPPTLIRTFLIATFTALIAAAPSPPSGQRLDTGWKLLKEGEAEGAIEQDAKHPTHDAPHLLRITATKTAEPGKGRVGATNDAHLTVKEGEWIDITFNAATERGSIGLVFSLESADGKVLARTTLPEIGRGARGRGARGAPPASAPAAWPHYLVALHARAADSNAHLTITPIEPTTMWLENLTLTPRASQ